MLSQKIQKGCFDDMLEISVTKYLMEYRSTKCIAVNIVAKDKALC